MANFWFIYSVLVGFADRSSQTLAVTWERGRGVRKPTVQIDGGMDNSVRHLVPATR